MNSIRGGPRTLMRFVAIGFLAAVTAGMGVADDFDVVVSLDNANGWGFIPEVAVATAALEHGPDVPPLGAGSANLVVNGTGRIFVGTLDFAGLPLANVNSLSYWTYQKDTSPGSSNLAISLQFEMDYDSADASMDWQGRLVFEPINDPNQDLPVKGMWQQWDARAGNWWMTGIPIVNGAPAPALFPQNAPGSFDDILAAYPNARIRPFIGALLLKAGGPWANGFDGNVDALSIGVGPNSFNFDFEVHEGEEPPSNDTDGDGIPDDEDEFPNSDLSPTVVIDGADTGVENILFENGGTLADFINALAAEASDHGGFAGSVADLANALRKDGTLTNKESAALKKWAAKSSLP